MNPITPEDLAITDATMKKLLRAAALVDELQKELKVQATHAESARDVLRSIRAALPPCDEEAHVNYMTGLESRLAALPARVEKLTREHEEVKRNAVGWQERAAKGETRIGVLTLEKAQLEQERKNWEETAAWHARNTEFYRDLLDKVAAHLGRDVFVSDDGSVQDEPLRLKIPGLVERLARENETLARNVPPFQPVDDIRTVEVIGQQWCRCDHESDVPEDALGLRFDTGWIVLCNVLCNVLRNVETGGLTYEPLARKDLPAFQ